MSLRPRAYGMVSMRGEKKGGRGQEGIMSKACGGRQGRGVEVAAEGLRETRGLVESERAVEASVNGI
ncbi:hypothetical protein Tco_0690814 [Tanacetum coccineum]